MPNEAGPNHPYNLEQILDLPAIKSVLEDLTNLTGVSTALLDLDGNVLIATAWSGICTRFHRVHPETSQNCRESDLYLTGHVDTGKYIMYKCKNGLWDAVTPLIIGGHHLGNIYIGQFFFADEEPDLQTFRQRARRCGFNEEAYMAELARIPRIEREQIATLMDYLVKFTAVIAASGLRSMDASRMAADYQLAEATLNASEARNQALISAVPDLIFVINGEGVFLDYRAATDTSLAIPKEQIIGNSISATMPPEIAAASMDCVREVLATGELRNLDYALPLPGGLCYFEARMVKMSDDAVICISRDITERRLAEEMVQNSANFLNAVISGSPIPQFVIDRQHTVLQWNNALERYSGIKASDIIGTRQHWRAFYDHECPCLVDLLVDGIVDGNADSYTGNLHPSANIDGAYEARDFFPHMKDSGRWLYFTAAPIRNAQGEIIGGIETLEDITDRMEKEEELQHINRVQSLILNNTAVGIAFVRDRAFEWVNPQLPKMLGLPLEKVCGASTAIIYPSQSEFEEIGIWAYEALGKGEWFEFEADTPRSDGSTYKGRVVGNALNPNQPQEGSIWIFEDISQRKKAEEERDTLRHLMKNIIDSMPSILVAVDTAGAVTQWNLEAAKATGIDSDHALNKPLTALIPQYTSHFDDLLEALADGQVHQEHRIMHAQDGEMHYSEVMIYPLAANALVGAVVRIDDVTDKVRLEEMMIQTEKMMSLGGLAAGMAHEINNPLSGIMQGIQNIERRLSADLPGNLKMAQQSGLDLKSMQQYLAGRQIPAILRGIQEAGNRASAIVNNMLQFSHGSNSQKEQVQANEVIERALELASNDYDLKRKYDFRHIEIIRDYETGMPRLWCIPNEIEQVLLNLFKNAAHALAASPPAGKNPAITVRTRHESGMGVLEVEDNGPGMDEALKKRIFEPFFTTKEAGVGTGLGLSVSYFIVSENHGGQMYVQSAPGQGARFIVQLPFSNPPRTGVGRDALP